MQLCLQHLRPGELARIERALGDAGRLPLYRAQLEVDPQAREVKGRLAITYFAKGRALGRLSLLARPNAAGGKLRILHAKVGGRTAVFEHPEPALYRLEVEPPVAAGSAAEVELSFEAEVPPAPPGSAGLLAAGRRGDYGAFMAAPEMMSLVGVIPAVAPEAADATVAAVGDPILVEPSNWLVSVVVPAAYRVHATGRALGEVPERNRTVRFSFGAAAARDFPVLVSRGYRSESAELGELTVESHFLEEDAEVGRRVLGHAKSAVEQMEKRLGPLPYTHLRVVESRLVGGAGGMEFPGLVTVSTGLYRGAQDPLGALGLGGLSGLFGKGGAAGLAPIVSPLIERTLEFAVAHEVAHQYFAMLVGSDPLAAPVVDEALAQAAALLYIEWKHGKAVAEEVRQGQLVTAYQLFRLGGGEDGRADRPSSKFSSSVEYAALVYGKAPHFHLEARKLLGEATYLKGLRAYVDAYRHQDACRDCLRQTLARQSPAHSKALASLQRRWWEEAHGDEDLGKPDLAKMVESATGVRLDQESREMLESLLPQLIGH
ncbi:MAG: aminopeptidase [Myxococcales bacterium]|nr:aminopeptidase [Myxococcales bacterium]